MSLTLDLYTPAHRNTFLLDAYNSIKNQNYTSWLIHPNNSLTIADIPKVILDDPRTVIVTSDDPPTTNIGALKRICCSVSKSDLCLEFDHDDILLPNAVEKVKKAFEENPEVVFVYSNSAHYNNEDTSPVFYGNANSETNEDTLYGWEYQDCWHDGTLYKAAITPEPIPYHTSIILFAADHLRSFRRSAYEAVGGYDASLSVLDDQDLMARLRMHGKFYHINECLYLYRIYQTNSWLLRNQEIQEGMVQMQKKYIRPLAEAWCKENNLPMLDLGGGFNCPPNYTSIDLRNSDIIADLNQRWPLETSTVGIIRASDILEHLKDSMHVLSEIHRVLVPGGYFFGMTPSTDGRGAWQAPDHISFFNQNSFFYVTRHDQARFINNTTIRFQEIVLETYFPDDYCKNNNISYVRSDLIALKAGGPKVMGMKLI